MLWISNDEVKAMAAEELKQSVLSVSKELTGDAFAKFLAEINQRIFELILSSDVHEKVGGIMAIEKLIDVDGEGNATKITRYGNYLGMALNNGDTQVMVLAARCLGKLVSPRIGGVFSSEFVELEVKKAIECLHLGEKHEFKKHGAVLVLKELALNSPASIFSHVPRILESLWLPLRDPKLIVRESASEAMSVCFELVYQREPQTRQAWFSKVCEEALRLLKSPNVDHIHGALLVIHELLLHTGKFMDPKYMEVCDVLLRLKDHKDGRIRRTVIQVIPTIASFNASAFELYLSRFMSYLITQLKRDRDRASAFLAVGKVALAVESSMKDFLEDIVKVIREVLLLKGKARLELQASVFHCISMLATSVGQALTKFLLDILDLCFVAGISKPLVQALVDVSSHIPPLLPAIQEKLLNLVSLILSQQPFRSAGSPLRSISNIMLPSSISLQGTSSTNVLSGAGSGFMGINPDNSTVANETRDTDSIILALDTVGSFDFGLNLNEFVSQIISLYLEDDIAEIRLAAALTCCRVLSSDPVRFQTSSYAIEQVNSVLERLLTVAAADPDPKIRLAVLSSLDDRFDHYLAKAENVHSIFLATNDEVFANRLVAMTTIGRIALCNPAHVLPFLRRMLIQLLTEFEYSNVARTKEECARLLSHLVGACRYLVKPYVEPILNVLLPKVKDTSPGVAAATLAAIGALSLVSGKNMLPHMTDLLPHVIDSLSDASSQARRLASLQTLGLICGATSYVIQPYWDYPTLLDTIINILKTESSNQVRQETMKLLGILGALDPYKHKQVNNRQVPDQINVMNKIDPQSMVILGIGPSHEDYYPSVAINALMTICRDNSLSMHHTASIKAVMYICRTLGLKCVPFLSQIIPPLLTVLQASIPAMFEFFFQELAQLVQLVGSHMTVYLPDIISLIEQHAKTLDLVVMTLVEALAVSLESDLISAHLPTLLPHILSMFDSDHSENRRATYKVLDILCIIGVGLQEYMFLVLKPLMRLIENSSAEINIRRYAVQTLGYIIQHVSLSHHSSRIIHPLVRCLAVPELRTSIMDAFTALMMQMCADFILFVSVIHKTYVRHRIQHPAYERCLAMQLRNEPLPEFVISPPAGQLFPSKQQVSQEPMQKLPVNQVALQKTWETSHKSTKDDWLEWLRRLSIELLKESPSLALRACSSLVSVHAPLARQLFNAAFVSCWSELYDQVQDELVFALETALTSPNIPPEVLQTLLNLAEFMEHDDKALPIDLRTLGKYAAKCQAYAKALHYKELEFVSEPSTAVIESLISINNNLQLPDAAVGVLTYAHQHHQVRLRENWYIKLERWDEGLVAFQRKALEDPYNFNITHGIMQCLHKLGEWEQLSQLSREKWINASAEERHTIAPFAAAAEWGLSHWDSMDDYINILKPDSPDGAFFRAILAVHRNLFPQARQYIDKTRELLDTEFTALVGESYNRSYDVVVRVQMLAELEEIVKYKHNHDHQEAQEMIRLTWKNRLLGTQRSVEVWDRMLKVRSVVLSAREDMEMWIKFSSLCRKSGRFGLSLKTLVNLLGFDPQHSDLLQGPPPAVYAYLKHMWESGENTSGAFQLLSTFTRQLSETVSVNVTVPPMVTGLTAATATVPTGPHGFVISNNSSYFGKDNVSQSRLLARCYFRMAEWQSQKLDNWPNDDSRHEILKGYLFATQCDNTWYKAWHAWALANLHVVTHFERMPQATPEETHSVIATHVVPALQGFVHSISLSKDTDSLQDTLRLLTLWFKYGNLNDVHLTIVEGFKNITIDTWLQVIPQLIARIHAPYSNVRRLIHQLLCDVGKEHPQALIYSLLVASKSPSKPRKRAALAILDKMRMYRADLVEQGLLVSQELIRVAILWHEQWHEALEEASRLYYGEGDADAMIATLEPLHNMMAAGPETLREISFHQMFGRDLAEAHEWTQRFQANREKESINQAWDLYFSVFKRIVKQLNQLTTLELQYISPALLAAKDLELAVPGTYRSGAPLVKIRRFSPQLSMFMTKQRPRRLTIHGDDGKEYNYLLKGHEDIRQDERCMQLFGLVNQLLENDAETFKRHLNIQRFPVIPLSPNSGLIGWVPHCDTLHSLIRDYRESRKILLNVEHRLMLQMAPDFDNLTLMQKIEVFEYALENTTGQDLHKILWLKSKNSEAWLDRRTNYARSLAVMSMVGYVLGLGDRHPSNLMLDRYSGRIVHIDFGDCFEVAMLRDKYPEKIPFRLTRMLINAMEVSGIEGTFRITSIHVMRVMRENKDSLMAVLEAFVHDPLINWRLMTNPSPRTDKKRKETESLEDGDKPILHPKRTQTNDTELSQQPEDDDENTQYKPEALNTRAVQVVHRVSNKLTGRDFKSTQVLDVPAQVDKLIVQATSLENLCLCYIGWCAFW